MAVNTNQVSNKVPIGKLPRVRRRDYGGYLFAVIVACIVAFVVYSFATGKIHWNTVGRYLLDPAILTGLVNTIVMTFIAFFFAVTIGTSIAVMRTSDNVILNKFSIGYLWLFRGMPQLLQLYLWYNIALVFPTLGIPGIFSLNTAFVMTPLVATIFGLSLCESAYCSEIIRGGLLSVDSGQREAAASIGMTPSKIMRKVILPQALRVIAPPLGNQFITIIKLTSLASAIEYTEILHSAQNIYFVNGQVIELLLVATFWYLVIITIFTFIQGTIERRLARGH